MSGPFDFPPSTQWGDFLFYMIHRGNDRPDWDHTLISHEGHIASSNIDVLQFDGYTDWTLTVECWFLNRDEWQAFRSFEGTAEEMRHRASLTTTATRAEIHEHPDGPYAHFENVTIEEISNVSPHPAFPDVTTATVKFRRSYTGELITTFGYSHFEEE